MILSHLDFLHDTLESAGGETVHVWWIYAKPAAEYRRRPPAETEYERFPASSEGIACVDDVARAAVVYLEHHDLHGDDHSLERARQALEFLRFMQLEDGQFLNFVVDPDLTEAVFGESDPEIVEGIRVNGSPTSEPDYGWWAARACWALGEGYRTFADRDADFAERLAESIHSYLDVVDDEVLSHYGEYTADRGVERPDWLVKDSYTTAPAVLGLASYHRASGDERSADRLRKLADAIRETGRGDAITPPFRAHLAAPPGDAWHTWGMRQAAALARTGSVLEEDAYVDAARREVAALHAHHASSHNQIGSFGPAPLPYHQLSYGTDALVQGCTELWRATGEPGFAQLGGQLATWYSGNNIEHTRMWDPEAGRGYDGIYEDTIDWKAGAESTIAAARTALDVARYPPSAQCRGDCGPHGDRPFTTVMASDGATQDRATRLVTGTGDSLLAGGRLVEVFQGGYLTVEPSLEPGTYRPYLVHEQTIAPDARAVVWIDGAVQTLDIGGSPESHLRMTSLDPIEIEADPTVEVGYEGAGDRSLRLDAIVFQPAVGYRVVETEDSAGAVARSFLDERRTVSLSMPLEDGQPVDLRAYDEQGTLIERSESRFDSPHEFEVPVEPRGFSICQGVPPESSRESQDYEEQTGV
jgi:hypothetical protein